LKLRIALLALQENDNSLSECVLTVSSHSRWSAVLRTWTKMIQIRSARQQKTTRLRSK
jgi:hypothetical protein